MARLTNIKRITKGVGNRLRDWVREWNTELLTLLILYLTLILWILNFNI